MKPLHPESAEHCLTIKVCYIRKMFVADDCIHL